MGLFNKLKEQLNEGLSSLDINVPGLGNKTSTPAPQQPQPFMTPQPQTIVHSTPPTAVTEKDEGLYDSKLEKLIDLALVDGELTEKEKQVLFKRAQEMGIDLDEFEMVLDARLHQNNATRINPTNTSSAPKSDKYGDVKKCPSCGAMIQSFTTNCPECGHEFSNIAANSSIQKLFEMLNQVESESKEDAQGLIGGLGRAYGDMFSSAFGGTKDTRKKKAIIQNFPIPNTKDDILEFLSLSVPLAKKPGFNSEDRQIGMYKVWHAKCEQIIMKAKFAMRDDKKTMELISEYAKELKIKI